MIFSTFLFVFESRARAGQTDGRKTRVMRPIGWPNNANIVSIVKESTVTCQLPLKMTDEINFENGRISNFQRHMALTLTLDRAIWHTFSDGHQLLLK